MKARPASWAAPVVALLAVAAPGPGCVPATDDLKPRGAAGAVVTPSAGARGEPFPTEDGWTVRFERLGLLGVLSASSRVSEVQSSALFFWNAAKKTDGFVRAIPAGPCDLQLRLVGFFNSTARDASAAIASGSDLDMEYTLAARFGREPDNKSGGLFEQSGAGAQFYTGPAVVVLARAQIGRRVVRTLLSLAPRSSVERAETKTIEVRPNDLVLGEIEVQAERLFTDHRGRVLFGNIAAADRDGDGFVYGPELAAVRLDSEIAAGAACERADVAPGGDPGTLSLRSGPVPPPRRLFVCETLLDVLAERADTLLRH
mgnify:CR=1 FL=1